MNLSHSTTSNFNQCPTYYKYDKVDCLERAEPPGAAANDLQWGVAIHAGLSAHYNGGDLRMVQDAFLKAYCEDLDASDVVKTREGGLRTLEAYVEWYRERDSLWEILYVEKGDAESAADRDSLRIDIVARHKTSGSIYFWDHKTTKKLGWEEEKYAIDGQVSRYTLYVREKFGDCAGAIINSICPMFRQRRWKDRPAGWDVQFSRSQPIIQSVEQLDQWRRSQLAWESMVDWCKETGTWPKHLGWKCSRCQFFELCQGAEGWKPSNSMYIKRPG